MYDELTGIYGPKKCEEILKQPVKKNSCCICFDLDGTSYINKTKGRDAGNELLKDFATYVNRVIEGDIFFGRVKSDDFLVMLYDVNEADVKLFMSKIYDEIRVHNKYTNILGSFYGTILSYSYGYALCETDGNMNNEQLYYAAFYEMMVGKKHFKVKLEEIATIMVVEDSFLSRNMLVEILKDLGYNVVGVSGGKELFENIDKINPEVVITDLIMPEIDGMSVISRLQKDYHDIKIMVCSARSDDDTRKEAFEHGADDYVTKPFDREMIRNAINRLKRM